MGYLVPVRDAQGTLPDVESSWDAVAVVSYHLGSYISRFSFGLGSGCLEMETRVLPRIQYKSREHSRLALGAILRTYLF